MQGTKRHLERLFRPLRTARGAVFAYESDSHRVVDANAALLDHWGYALERFVGTADGLYGLWVNPLDWEIHRDLLQARWVCAGLRTRLARVDGQVIESDVTSVRLDGGKAGCWVISYVLPAGLGEGLPIHFEDERDFRHLLAQPEADEARAALLDVGGVPYRAAPVNPGKARRAAAH